MEEKTLNNAVKTPVLGLGVFLMPNDGTTYKTVREALDMGYRHIDTAAAYFNESEVGKAVADSGIPREEIFVTSKLWLQDFGYEQSKLGTETSLSNLGFDYIDLYLLHQPYGDVLGAWEGLEEMCANGKLRAIGVSNMTPKIYGEYVPKFKTKPAVNQVECNPYFRQAALREKMAPDNVDIEAYYPLGHGDKKLLSDPVIARIAKDRGKSEVQIILRYEIQDGLIVLPKTTNKEHLKDNLDIFTFELSDEEMQEMRALDTGKGTHDPEAPGMGEHLLNAFKIHD